MMGSCEFTPSPNATTAVQRLGLLLFRNSVNFGLDSRLSKSTGDFPLFAMVFRAAVIVLHHLLEHLV